MVIGPQNQTCDKCSWVANRDCSQATKHPIAGARGVRVCGAVLLQLQAF